MPTHHQQILDRDDDNRKRKQRLAKIKRGPGTFVYDGSHEDVHYEPTPLLRGRAEAAYNADGSLKVDRSGRQVFEKQGAPVRNEAGQIKLGGKPNVVRRKLETITVRGVVLPKGEPVLVGDPAKALKLRTMGGFHELDDDDVAEQKPRRGRPRKQPSGVAGDPAPDGDEDGVSDE